MTPTQLDPDSFAFHVHWDNQGPMIGMHIVGMDGENLILPLDLDTAENIGTVLLAHVAALTSAAERMTSHAH